MERPYLEIVLKSHDDMLKEKLVELGQYEEYSKYLPKVSSYFEEDIRNRITEHAIQIAALNSQLVDIRIRQLQNIKETIETLEMT